MSNVQEMKLNHAERDSLRAECENKNGRIEVLVKDLSTAEQTIVDLRRQLELANRRIGELEAACSKHEATIADETAKNVKLTSQLEGLTAVANSLQRDKDFLEQEVL